MGLTFCLTELHLPASYQAVTHKHSINKRETVSGIPTLAYGFGSWMLAQHHRDVRMENGKCVRIFFLNIEDENAEY